MATYRVVYGHAASPAFEAADDAAAFAHANSQTSWQQALWSISGSMTFTRDHLEILVRDECGNSQWEMAWIVTARARLRAA